MRVYSQIEFKAAEQSDGRRILTGIASTPATDRVGDIVEPGGAQFTLPVPLLWHHDSQAPIGWVREAQVRDAGIFISGEVARSPKPGALQERLDEAWDTMRMGLVRGLSIGFNPIESTRIQGTYSRRYVKWDWLELSAVTVPANGECTITGIKAADELLRRAALGADGERNRRIVWLGQNKPGVTGSPIAKAAEIRRAGVVYL